MRGAIVTLMVAAVASRIEAVGASTAAVGPAQLCAASVGQHALGMPRPRRTPRPRLTPCRNCSPSTSAFNTDEGRPFGTGAICQVTNT